MKTHETNETCPRCEERMTLTTERGWVDAHTVTAVLACPTCRTECGKDDDVLIMAHGQDEEAALAALAAVTAI